MSNNSEIFDAIARAETEYREALGLELDLYQRRDDLPKKSRLKELRDLILNYPDLNYNEVNRLISLSDKWRQEVGDQINFLAGLVEGRFNLESVKYSPKDKMFSSIYSINNINGSNGFFIVKREDQDLLVARGERDEAIIEVCRDKRPMAYLYEGFSIPVLSEKKKSQNKLVVGSLSSHPHSLRELLSL